MGLGHKRTDLRAMAEAKLQDALLLLQHGRFSNAYYLAGYAVELSLKACIAAQIVAETIPDKDLIKRVFDHQFGNLVGLAGLKSDLKSREDADAVFAANWAIACEWSPDVRYESIEPTTAQLMITALTHDKSGVLQWIKAHW